MTRLTTWHVPLVQGMEVYLGAGPLVCCVQSQTYPAGDYAAVTTLEDHVPAEAPQRRVAAFRGDLIIPDGAHHFASLTVQPWQDRIGFLSNVLPMTWHLIEYDPPEHIEITNGLGEVITTRGSNL